MVVGRSIFLGRTLLDWIGYGQVVSFRIYLLNRSLQTSLPYSARYCSRFHWSSAWLTLRSLTHIASPRIYPNIYPQTVSHRSDRLLDTTDRWSSVWYPIWLLHQLRVSLLLGSRTIPNKHKRICTRLSLGNSQNMMIRHSIPKMRI